MWLAHAAPATATLQQQSATMQEVKAVAAADEYKGATDSVAALADAADRFLDTCIDNPGSRASEAIRNQFE